METSFTIRTQAFVARLDRCSRIVWFGFAMLLLFALAAPFASAQILIEVECTEQNGECVEILNPNPVQINVGEQVQWLIRSECGIPPCSGVCVINVPPGPGFPGFFDDVNAGQLSNVTPQFNQQGVFYYQLECSPVVIGTIIVGNPTMQLFINGPCPGTVTLTASGATAGGKVFFGYGFSSGTTNVPGCPGLKVDIGNAKL